MHCHHEKTIVIDDRIAFVGGIDLTNFNGDRWDAPDHPPRGAVGWHDVAARIAGPAVQDVSENFAMRWLAITGESLPAVTPPSPAGDVELQIARTVPDGMYSQLPRGDFRILESYLRALRAAQRLIRFSGLDFNSVFFVNSGAEANENALKMAFAITQRTQVAAIEHSFHGRTAAAGDTP